MLNLEKATLSLNVGGQACELDIAEASVQPPPERGRQANDPMTRRSSRSVISQQCSSPDSQRAGHVARKFSASATDRCVGKIR